MQTNLEYYKIFYYVSKYNSISLAAEALSISQPAVSQAVKHLESDLSCALFVRTSKGVRLTKEGGLLAEYVRKGYETILTGEKKLSEMLNLDAGEICVGASDMTLQFYLLPYLETFHDAFPQIKVTVTNAPTPETLKGGKLSYKELENLPVMCLEGSTSTRKYVEDYLAERGTFVRPEFELATSDMLIQFAVRNLGVASVVSDFAEKYIENGELFVLKFDRAIPEREFCIVSNERAPMSAAAEKLYDFLLVP